MAAPGMGDVLTGIIAAFVAQGLSLEDAASAGVEIHARAGDRAARDGERGLLASDLLAEEMDYLGPVRLSTVEQIQLQIVDIIRRLEDAGELTIQGTDEDETFIG